jgi:hypothetical protein
MTKTKAQTKTAAPTVPLHPLFEHAHPAMFETRNTDHFPEQLYVGIDPGTDAIHVCVIRTLFGIPMGTKSVGFAFKDKDENGKDVPIKSTGMNSGAMAEFVLAFDALIKDMNDTGAATVSVVIEDVRKAIRPGQRPQDAVDLSFSCALSAMAALAVTGECEFVRPQTWRSFFAMTSHDHEATNKAISLRTGENARIDLALMHYVRRLDPECIAKNTAGVAEERMGREAAENLRETMLFEPDEPSIPSFADIVKQVSVDRDDHNVADATLIATMAMTQKEFGWDRYRLAGRTYLPTH